MNKIRKLLGLLFALVLLTSMFAACQNDAGNGADTTAPAEQEEAAPEPEPEDPPAQEEDPPAEPEDPPAQEEDPPAAEVQLHFMSNGAEHIYTLLAETIASFQMDGVTIFHDHVMGTTADYLERLEIMFAANEFPDVIYLPAVWTKRYAAMGIAQDLTDLVCADYVADFAEGPMTVVTVDGRYMGLPMFSDCIAVYYNVEMFEQAGITDVPTRHEDAWTWDEILDVASRVQEANNTLYGIGVSADLSNLITFIWHAGSRVMSPDQSTVVINQPGTHEMLYWFRYEWVNTGLSSAEMLAGVENSNDFFTHQLIPIAITWSGMAGAFIRDIEDFTVGVTFMPRHRLATTRIGGWNIGIFNATEHLDESIALMKHILEPENMNRIAVATGNMPSRFSAQESIVFEGPLAEWAPIFMEQIATVDPIAIEDSISVAYGIFKPLVEAEFENFIINPNITAEEAAAEMEAQLIQAIFP